MVNNNYINNELYEAIYKLNLGFELDEEKTYGAMKNILSIQDKDKRIVLMTMLLSGLMIKNPSVAEIKGLLRAALELDSVAMDIKKKIILPKNNILLGHASSGKKGVKTFNISTTSAIVAAANGAFIAKGCSAGTSSKTGSADYLSLIGADINIDEKTKENILVEKGIMFCSIENTTPKFAELYGGLFYVPHAMSFALAALSLPVSVDMMVYGLAHPNVRLSAEVLKTFGVNEAFVYTSTNDRIHYLDEFGISGYANTIKVKDGIVENEVEKSISEEFGLDEYYVNDEIREEKNAIDNVKKSIRTLKGIETKASIDVICVNAGILLFLAQKVKNLKDGYRVALESIKNGKCYNHFIEIVTAYGSSEANINNFLR